MRRALSLLVILSALDLLAAARGRVVEPPAAPFLVIVHPSNEETTFTRRALSLLFLKKVTKWKDGRSVVPFDLADASPTRATFSQLVHGRHVPAIKSYWQQQIFSGRAIPPRELDSEEEVVGLVARTPGAVAYVSASTSLKGVKIVKLEE